MTELQENEADSPPGSIDALIRVQARRAPHRVAVSCGTERLTFHELTAGAAAFAAVLRRRGIRRGDLVGLFVERSLSLPVALLGILTAGAGYVPLDPSYPLDRLSYMLHDSGAVALVTESGLADRLGTDGRLPVIRIDETFSAQGELVGGEPDLPAYAIYTSGSTGRPKGTLVAHRSVVNLAEALDDLLGTGPDDVVLAQTPLSFDVSVADLLLPLTAGAHVRLVGREIAADGEALAAELMHCGATWLYATPTSLRMLVEAGWAGSAAISLVAAGEALPLDLAEMLAQRCGRLWNIYGPTEITVYATGGAVAPGVDRITIGRPLRGVRAHIVDADLEPVAPGTIGELCIGGAGVTYGYLHRPALTAERFVPDPFGDEPGARLYRTGDRARLLDDSAIEYLGRADQQTKLRGYRIELAEVEAALRAHPAVRDGVVTVAGQTSADQILVAYLTLRPGDQPTAAELRTLLADRLPTYMLPAEFRVVDTLPTAPSGKADRLALQAMRTRLPVLPETHADRPPDTAVTSLLAGIWMDVLDRDALGVDTNLFEIGANSLRVLRVVAAYRDGLGVNVVPADLFDHPTVAAQAGMLQRGAGGDLEPVAQRLLALMVDEDVA